MISGKELPRVTEVGQLFETARGNGVTVIGTVTVLTKAPEIVPVIVAVDLPMAVDVVVTTVSVEFCYPLGRI